MWFIMIALKKGQSHWIAFKMLLAKFVDGLLISIWTSPAHDSTKFIDVLENISDFLNDDLIHAIVSAYADKGYAAYSEINLRCYGINCCNTKRTQRQFHKTRIKNGLWQNKICCWKIFCMAQMYFIELQSDMRGIVIIILDLFTWHQF